MPAISPQLLNTSNSVIGELTPLHRETGRVEKIGQLTVGLNCLLLYFLRQLPQNNVQRANETKSWPLDSKQARASHQHAIQQKYLLGLEHQFSAFILLINFLNYSCGLSSWLSVCASKFTKTWFIILKTFEVFEWIPRPKHFLCS